MPTKYTKQRDDWMARYAATKAAESCARGFKGKHGPDREFGSWCADWNLPYATGGTTSTVPPAPVTPPSPLAPTPPPAAPPPVAEAPVAPAAGGGALEPAAPVVTGFELPSSSGADLARGEVSGLGEGGGFLEADFNEVRSTSDGAAPASSGGGGLLLLALAAGGYFLLRKRRRRR